MGKIRVLIAEDSLTIRKVIAGALAERPGFEVVGEAEDGGRAIELCEALRPDVITMDVVMPRLSGLQATEHIMAFRPTPILIVSSSLNRGEAFDTFDALAAGAVDVLEKPSGTEDLSSWARELRNRVDLVSRIQVIAHPRARLAARRAVDAAGRSATGSVASQAGRCGLVAIGGSTGAPAALARILGELPSDFPVPMLIVVHVGQHFARSLGEWLDKQSAIRVSIAEEGEPLPMGSPSRVLLAPAGCHLTVHDWRVRLSDAPERHSCKPSVDVLFESVAREVGRHAIGCVLTGMGTDGAEGLLAIRRAGGETLVQDQDTSVIFGMPQQAISLGAAAHVVSLPRIARTLACLCDGSRWDGGPHRDPRADC